MMVLLGAAPERAFPQHPLSTDEHGGARCPVDGDHVVTNAIGERGEELVGSWLRIAGMKSDQC